MQIIGKLTFMKVNEDLYRLTPPSYDFNPPLHLRGFTTLYTSPRD